MRKSLWIILAALIVAFGATTARADSTSTFNFDATYGQAPTSGLIDCDSVGCPNSINATVVWEGLTFTFSDAALTAGLAPDIAAVYPSCNAAAGSSAQAFQTLNGCSGYDGWSTVNFNGTWLLSLDSGTPGGFFEAAGVGTADDGALASGGSFTDPVPESTPEPGSLALTVSGLALLGLMLARKRMARGQHQDA
jgi:hypothetical protein